MNKCGKVWLVGAGPGDIGLLTLKGKKVLENAEVVVYDSLVGDSILTLIPSSAEKIDAGKRAGAHKVPQEETNRILLKKALEGKRVVRLKGGDPFLFGRGGEELELLSENNIPFEVVPGVPSPIAVTAYNGIPVTHRDYTSSVHFITAHRRLVSSSGIQAGATVTGQNAEGISDEKYEEPLNFPALVQEGGTIVFLMGASRIPAICEGLAGAGMDPEMPAAVLSRGTTARQKRITGTITELPKLIRENPSRLETPALLVVGKVCELADTFAWYEKLPLFGWRVLVTRPEGLSSTLSEKLRTLGAEVLEIPAIATVPISDNKRLEEALRHLEQYQWAAFTSPSGVRIFFEQMEQSGIDVRSLGHLKIAALGKGTAKELKKHGILADVIPKVFDGKALGEAIAEAAEPGSRILIPRAEIGNRELVDELRNYTIDDIPTYHTVYRPSEIIDEAELFENNEIDCAVFTSSSSVKAFAACNPDLDFEKVCAACIGRQTARTAAGYGMQVSIADEASIDSLTELVIRMRKASL